MKYYIFGIAILSLLGCSTQEKVTSTGSEPIIATVPHDVQVCVACHGPGGRDGKVGVPPIGGRPYPELVKALENIRDTYSPQPLLAHTMSDKDIHEIASYFSSVK